MSRGRFWWRGIVGVLVVTFCGAAVAEAQLVLTGSDEFDVTVAYDTGTLFDSSVADVLPSGSIGAALLWNGSVLRVSGGNVNTVNARDSSGVSVGDGAVFAVNLHDASTFEQSGGTVTWLHANNLRRGVERVNIEGGQVTNLWVNLVVDGDDHLAVSQSGMSAALEQYGVVSGGGSVENTVWDTVTALQTGSVSMSSGNVINLVAGDQGRIEFSGGGVSWVDVNDSGMLLISGGQASVVDVRDSAEATIAGGVVQHLSAYGEAAVTMSGGGVSYLDAFGNANVVLSGGTIGELGVYGSSVISFQGYDFAAGEGLTIDGTLVLGSGELSGRWFDGSSWSVSILGNGSDATVTVVPGPGSVVLLTLGLGWIFGRGRMKGACGGG